MKSTKKALLLSITSMLLCVAMLTGTTFAWFTDTVTSGVNKIVAGNLDIDVQFTKDNGATWADLEGSASVFSSNLWEPGHTEYVTLKIENKGTLDLKYCMNVTPINEKGGINVDGESFKLSDYLVFKTTAPSSTQTDVSDRDAAQALAGTETKLNQANLTQTSGLEAGETEYITLVVYMPETVGNKANYKTGTAAPKIELGIKFIATQMASESDSFGTDYDNGAVNVAPYNVGPVYDYFPQAFASAPVAETGDTVISATGKLNKEDVEDTELAKVTVPAEAVEEDATELTVSVKPVEATNEGALNQIQTQKAAGQEVANFDIKVDGIKEGNTAAITVEVFVGKGLSNVKAFHNGEEITGATYDASTGKVTFTTTSFSDYTVSYDPAMAAIGTQTYGTLALAINAVQNGETIVLLKDVASAGGISVPSGKNFTVDFNGFTYTTEKPGAGSAGTKTQAFQLLKGSTITFKNGTIACTEANKVATWTSASTEKGVAMIIQNYADLTLDNMVIDGTNIAHNDANVRYVVSNNCGNVEIKDTKIIAVEGDFAFDSCKYVNYSVPTVTVSGKSEINGKVEMSGGNLTITSGTLNKYIVKSAEDGDLVINSENVEPSADIYITSANALRAYAADANDGKVNGKTAVLTTDIDLENVEWTQINGAGKNITFNGNGKTIKNLKVSTGHNAGFFSTGSGCTIKNLTVDGATVTGVGRIGVICGHGMCVTVDNCTVKNATVTAVVTNNDDGDKAGAIVGYLSAEPNAYVTNCKVENVTVQGYRDVGALVGYAAGTYTITGNTLADIKVICDKSNNYKNYETDPEFDVNFIVGEKGASGTYAKTGIIAGTYDVNPTDFVMTGYEVSETEDKKFVVELGIEPLENLFVALSSGTGVIPETVCVNKPTTISSLVNAQGKPDFEPSLKNVKTTINLQSELSTGDYDWNYGSFRITDSSDITLKGNENGKFINTNCIAVCTIENTSHLTIESAEYHTPKRAWSSIIGLSFFTDGIAGTIDVKGGTFIFDGADKENQVPFVSTNKDNPQYCGFIITPSMNYVTLNVTGGTFYNCDPTGYTAAGYKVVSQEIGNDMVYTVVAEAN